MTSMGLGERVENRQDASPGSAKTLGERIGGGDRRLELIEEVSQHVERRACRPLVGERQPARERRCAAARRGAGGAFLVPSRIARRRERPRDPAGRQLLEPFGVAGMIEHAQPDLERRDVAAGHEHIGRGKPEVRRPEERRQRRGAEPRRDRGEDEIERRGEGLGGERQRIAQLHGNAARREDFSGRDRRTAGVAGRRPLCDRAERRDADDEARECGARRRTARPRDRGW